MAITYVAAGAANTSVVDDPAFAFPVGITDDDFVLAAFYSRENTDGTVHLVDPSVTQIWTRILNVRTAGGLIAVWGKRYVTGDTEPTIVTTNHTRGFNGDDIIVQMAAWRGVNTSNPIAQVGTVSANASAADIGPIAGITAFPNNAVIVLAGKMGSWTSVATLSGDLTYTEISDLTTTGEPDAGMVWDYGINGASATEITDKTFTVTGGALAPGVGVMIELNEAATQSGIGGTIASSTGTFGTLVTTTEGIDAQGTVAWTAPTDAASSNDLRATSILTVVDAGTEVLRGTNTTWSPAIPANAQIVGLEAIVERSDAGTGDTAYFSVVQLWYNSDWLGEDKALGIDDRFPPIDADETFGSDGDGWGINLSIDILENSGFGLGIRCGVDPTGDGANPRIDFMRLKVYYVQQGGGPTFSDPDGRRNPNLPGGTANVQRWPYHHRGLERKRRWIYAPRR